MKKTFRIATLLFLTVLLTLPAGPVAFGDTVRIGDVDGDGAITPQDANLITRYLAHFRNLDAAQRSRADFNGDGEITADDATLILSAVVAMEEREQTLWNISMIVSADLKGEAWGSNSEKEVGSSSALNLATYVKQEREKDPNLLLIDAGGSLFGSAIADEYSNYTNKHYGPMTRIFMNLGYNAVLLGTEAVTHQSQMIRNDMDYLKDQGISVLGANLSKVYPLITEPDTTPWNDILPYCILEVPRSEGRSLHVGVIGIVEPDLAEPYDEVYISDPLTCYETFKSKLKGSCDLTVLLYCGSVESDESQEKSYSLRSFLRQISDVDLVLVSYGAGESIRYAADGKGNNVPVISLPEGSNAVMKLSIAKRENDTIAFLSEKVNLRDYAPDADLSKQIHPYVNAVSQMMDARVGALSERIAPFATDALGVTDGMELLHEMQIWGATEWIQASGRDLPQTIISIAYPYIGTNGWNAGSVRYRDICAHTLNPPRYTLMMVRGSELRAWLNDYAHRIRTDKYVYSLHGLSYLLNTLNEDSPLGYLEHSSGLAVEEDETFTLILADDPTSESILLPYLDEDWMSYEDRVIDDFEMPQPIYTETSDVYRNANILVAFFESVGTLTLKHETGWIII